METLFVLFLLGAAFLYLAVRTVRTFRKIRSKEGACGSCCGCSSPHDKLKKLN